MIRNQKDLKSLTKDINKNLSNIKSLLKQLDNFQYAETNMSKNVINVKDNIIGKLPRKLLSQKYFPQNSDIAEFAQKYLEINIPNFEKKSRPELIGHIVVNVENLDENKLIKFNDALNIVSGKSEKKTEKSFFLEWEQAIKEIELK